MLKVYLIFLFFIANITGYSQGTFASYKKIADELIKTHFSKSLGKKIKCEAIRTFSKKNEESYYPSYDMYSNERENFSKVEFTYSFYIEEIKDKIDFYISILKNKKIENEKQIFRDIPICAIKNTVCGFIKKDSAVQLAIKDKIPYPNNVIIQFVRDSKSLKYCWVIDSYPETNPDSKRGSRKFNQNQTRTVDALTGELLSGR